MAQLKEVQIVANDWNGTVPGSLENQFVEFYLTPANKHFNSKFIIYSVHFQWQSFGIAKTNNAPADWNVTATLQKLRSKEKIAADRHYTVRVIQGGWERKHSDPTSTPDEWVFDDSDSGDGEQYTLKWSLKPNWNFTEGIEGQGKLRLLLEHGGSNNMASCNNNPTMSILIEYDVLETKDIMDWSNLEVNS